MFLKDETSLLVKQFNGLNIQVYGTFEEPLFKANDIGDLLSMSNIRETIKGFNNKQKVVSLGQHEVIFLTEQGLYKVLMRSRKKIAEQFQDWVCEVVEEIRKKGKYDLEEKLKENELEYQKQIDAKEKELLKYKEKTYEEIEKTGHLYVIKTDGGTKVGKTKDTVTKRVKGLQTGNVNDIEVILDYQTCNADLLEKFVHFILERYRCNSNREFFDCELDFIKKVVLTSGKVMDTLKSCYHQISDDEFAARLKQHAVEVYVNASNGDTVDHEQLEQPDFYNWCTQNIQESKNSVLKLADVVCAFTCTTCNLHSKESSKYKTQLEHFIHTHYPMIRHEHGIVTVGDKQYRGWKGLELKLNSQFPD